MLPTRPTEQERLEAEEISERLGEKKGKTRLSPQSLNAQQVLGQGSWFCEWVRANLVQWEPRMLRFWWVGQQRGLGKTGLEQRKHQRGVRCDEDTNRVAY